LLIESLAGEFEPEKYHDTYRANLEKMIQAKIEGHAVVETPATHIAPVIDIMEALRKSLEAKKPVQREEEQAEPVAAAKKRSGQKRASRSSA